jgi:hypothetical protein
MPIKHLLHPKGPRRSDDGIGALVRHAFIVLAGWIHFG